MPRRDSPENRFPRWRRPAFDERGMTKWGWMCQHPEKLRLGKYVDIGAFTYINAKYGVEIGELAQVGSHSSIYSVSTIDGKRGKVVIKRNARIGSHSVVMPGVTIGENAVVGAFSFVKSDVPADAVAYGIPARMVGRGGGLGRRRGV
ncbi:MAG TPA: acyltransferase [Nitrososphaerales archaeon]|nr:acyltransferase [Nitrososphaerales archaeon]